MTIQKILHGWRDKKAAFILITEFIGIRSNIYSHIKDGDKGGKTAKGIKKNVIKKNIKHEDYKHVLFNNKQMYQTMKSIRSNNHQLWSYEPNKVSLSCFDYKRYMLNGINSYVYGHYRISKVVTLRHSWGSLVSDPTFWWRLPDFIYQFFAYVDHIRSRK